MAFVTMLALKIVANPYPFGSPVKCLVFSWLTLSSDLKKYVQTCIHKICVIFQSVIFLRAIEACGGHLKFSI